MEDGNPLYYIGIILVLMVVEAVIASAKKALESVTEAGILRIVEKESRLSKKADRVLYFLDHEDAYVSTVQFLRNVINFTIGILYATALMNYSWIVTICLPLIIYLFCFVFPVKAAILNPEKTALRVAGFLRACQIICFPFVWITESIGKLVFALFKVNPEDLEDNVTEDEIISIVNEGFEQGVLEDSEAEMISNIIELDGKEVRHVMTNRKKVVSINADLSLKEALDFMLKDRYTRFPLYEEELDNVIGVLHIKDVMQHYIAGEDVSLKEIAREPYFVPDTQSVDTLFDDMQLKKIHMAIAVDEYGQMAGVVALEDILEEIVGNILDEYDEDERLILKQSSNRYIMRGLAPLDEVEDELGIRMECEDHEVDVDTLNGFLLSFLGHLPADNEKPVIRFGGYRFHVLDVKNNMIRTVRVVKETKVEEQES